MLRIYGDLHARLRLALALLQVSALCEGHLQESQNLKRYVRVLLPSYCSLMILESIHQIVEMNIYYVCQIELNLICVLS